MAPLRDGGRRIILGHAHDVRETASLLAADPLSVFRIVDALDPPSREVDFDQFVAAAVERVRRRFSSRGRNQGNKYARVELEILTAIAAGNTDKAIADEFKISIAGVRKHLLAITSKLGACSRTEAVSIALRKRLLKL